MPHFLLLSKRRDFAIVGEADEAEAFLVDVRLPPDAELYEKPRNSCDWDGWNALTTYVAGRAWAEENRAPRYSIPPKRIRLRRG